MQIILYVSNNDASLLSGVVPAHSSLQCEFVCLPTHESADSALFRLVVLGEGGGAGGVASSEGGSTVVVGTAEESNFLTLKAEVCVCACMRARLSALKCIVYTYVVGLNDFLPTPSIPGQLGHPVCSFQEQRVLFGSVPLGLNTVRTVHLKNNGHSHTFFKVCK